MTHTPRLVNVRQIATTAGKPGILPVSVPTIWRWVAEGNFPKPIKLGPKTTVWNLDEIEVFLAQRAGGATA
jgi:predicted DNA-binding transcriptional regulator AlpA